MSRESEKPIPWGCEPIKIIRVHGQHVLAGEGNRILIWLLSTQGDTTDPLVVKVFPEGSVITSLSCSSNDNRLSILATSLSFYRKVSVGFGLGGDIMLGSTLEGSHGELMSGHCWEGGYMVYDFNNVATVHESQSSDAELVTVYQGHLGAPDCVTISGAKKGDIFIFVATSSRVSICRLSEPALNNIEIHTLFTFCQPKGVIFSVNFYPDSKLILTTSDDRSVSVWKCNFSEFEVESLTTDQVSVTLQATLEGHTSRVFNSILVHNNVVSIGEDSNIVAWSLQNLSRHRVIGNHSGCTIWSCAYDPLHGSVYTGADNGSIFKWSLDQILQDYELTQYCELSPAWTLNASNQPMRDSPKGSEDYPRLVKSFDEASSVVTTHTGKLFIVSQDSVRYFNHLPSWKGYLSFAWHPSRKFYVTGTLNGQISFIGIQSIDNDHKLLHGDTLSLTIPVQDKVLTLHFLSESELIISTITSLLKYDLSFTPDSSLPHPSLNWTVKQKSNTNCVASWKNVLFVGLDNGKIKAYNRSTGGKLYEFKARHNKYGVGGIVEYQGHLVTGGRDSSLNFFFIESDFGAGDDNQEIQGSEPVTHLKTVPLPFLWVGSLVKYRGDLLVCGFESADFVIYSYRREQIIGRTSCGGAHRAWDFILSENGAGVFTHIRIRRVFKTCFQLDHCITNCVKEGFHLEDVNSVIELPNSSDEAIVIASGSEDGAVKISTFKIGRRSSSGNIRFIKDNTQTVCNHTSGVKCLHYQELRPHQEGYLFSGGGRSEIILIKIYLEGCQLKKYSNLRRFGFDDNLDFRVMDIKSLLLPESEAIDSAIKQIPVGFIACSDGLLRVIRENGNYKFSRIHRKGTGAKHCLIALEILHQTSSEVTIFGGTSSGEILAWKMNCLIKGNDECSDSWVIEPEVNAQCIFKLGTVPITSITIIPTLKPVIVIGGDDGSLHRGSIEEFLQESGSSFHQKVDVTNDGILGLQRWGVAGDENGGLRGSIYFVSGGKLYKSGEKLDNLCCVRIPIQDGKGAKICRPIKFNGALYRPIISYGKGVSVFTLKF